MDDPEPGRGGDPGRGIRFGVRTRIAAGFTTVLVGILVVGSLSWFSLKGVIDPMQQVEDSNHVLQLADRVLEDVVDAEAAMRSYRRLQDDEFFRSFQRAAPQLAEHLGRLREAVAESPAQREQLARLELLAQRRLALAAEQVAGLHAGERPLLNDGREVMEAFRGAVERFRAVEQQRIEEQGASAHRAVQTTLMVIVLAGLGLGLLLGLGTWLLARSITRPLGRLVSAAERIGRGEPPLFPAPRGDEVGVLGAALEEMFVMREEAEARTRDLIELAPEAYFLADLDGRCVDVNDAACALLGYPREELIGKTALDLLSPADAPSFEITREALLVPGATQVAPRQLVRKDGSLVCVEVSSRIISGGRWLAFVRDQTERKRREAEQQFLTRITGVLGASLIGPQNLETAAQELVSFMGDLCVIDLLDGDRFTRQVVRYADPSKAARLERLQKFPMDAARLARAYPDLGALKSTLVGRVVVEALGPVTTLAVPMVSRDVCFGYITLVSISPERLYGHGDVELVEEAARRAAVAIDNARLYEQSREAIRARDNVLHVVAHDLRNPLNGIQLQASTLLRRGPEPERRQRSKRVVDAIKHSLAGASRLIEDLLDVAQLDNQGLLRLKKENLAPEELVREALQLLTPAASHASITLESTADLIPGLEVCVDRDRMVRVLSNLIANAVKFTPANGQVQVLTGVPNRELQICVRDTGPGIAPADLGLVFERFWQGDPASTRGIGLGLAIARSIVEQHGGRLWAESLCGAGASFYLALPVAPPRPLDPPG